MPETFFSLQRIKNSGLIWTWLALLVIILDRISKILATRYLDYHTPKVIFPFLNLTLTFNTGAAFSFLDHASGWQNGVLGGLAFVVSAGVLMWLWRLSVRDKAIAISLCLILGGALGNAWDRILHGFVIDFLSFHWHDWYFAIFNIADSAISLGAFFLFFHWFLRRG